MTNTRENNIKVLADLGYGLEEESSGKLHLYSPKFLYIQHFHNHDELAEWIEQNLR